MGIPLSSARWCQDEPTERVAATHENTLTFSDFAVHINNIVNPQLSRRFKPWKPFVSHLRSQAPGRDREPHARPKPVTGTWSVAWRRAEKKRGFGVSWWGSIILSFQGHQANFCEPHPHACMFACVCVWARERKRGPWPLRALCEETTAVHSQQLIGPYLAVPFIFIFYQLLSIICVLSWVWDLILFG